MLLLLLEGSVCSQTQAGGSRYGMLLVCLLLTGHSSVLGPRSYSFLMTFAQETFELSPRSCNYLPFFILKLGTFQHCVSLQCFLNQA